MAIVFLVVIISALLLQAAFTLLYHKWIPAWVHNPYGRLAQLDSVCRIILLSTALFSFTVGKDFSHEVNAVLYTVAIAPLLFFGTLQLYLLKRAVDLAKSEASSKKNKENE